MRIRKVPRSNLVINNKIYTRQEFASTEEQLDKFFETGKYEELINVWQANKLHILHFFKNFSSILAIKFIF